MVDTNRPRPLAVGAGAGRLVSIGTGIARRLGRTHDLVLIYSSAYDRRVHDQHDGSCRGSGRSWNNPGAQVTMIETDLSDADEALDQP